MAQYQSFPGAVGDSRTLDKLKSLRLPDLAGRTFLDVGCNEGFFCGFAKFQGAARSVGIDNSRPFIARARQRFPDCEFHLQGWEKLPDGTFDVILLASALHYADDQPTLLRRLVERLSPNGVLVLELGIVSLAKSEWVKVKRGIDERYFPSMPKLREVLKDYAWKWMGPSIMQDGDPVARHVIHVSARRPIAYLMMQPPAYGKTSIASRLFASADLALVSGDQLISLVAQGKREVPATLQRAISDAYSPFHIDQAIQRIFDSGLGDDMVRLWTAEAGKDRDLALDAYVPLGHQEQVTAAFAALGYMPVKLQWERPNLALLPNDAIDAQAEAFYMSMVRDPDQTTDPGPDAGHQGSAGFIDEVALSDGKLIIRGWAVNSARELPKRLIVTFRKRVIVVDDFEKVQRPDVQRHMNLPHALFGYRATIDIQGIKDGELAGIKVFMDEQKSIELQMSGPVSKL